MTHPAMNSDAAIRWNNMTDTLPPLPPYTYGKECGANERVWSERDMRAYAAAAVAAEREACAELAAAAVCDTHIPTGVKIYGRRAADAIRARKP